MEKDRASVEINQHVISADLGRLGARLEHGGGGNRARLVHEWNFFKSNLWRKVTESSLSEVDKAAWGRAIDIAQPRFCTGRDIQLYHDEFAKGISSTLPLLETKGMPVLTFNRQFSSDFRAKAAFKDVYILDGESPNIKLDDMTQIRLIAKGIDGAQVNIKLEDLAVAAFTEEQVHSAPAKKLLEKKTKYLLGNNTVGYTPQQSIFIGIKPIQAFAEKLVSDDAQENVNLVIKIRNEMAKQGVILEEGSKQLTTCVEKVRLPKIKTLARAVLVNGFKEFTLSPNYLDNPGSWDWQQDIEIDDEAQRLAVTEQEVLKEAGQIVDVIKHSILNTSNQ